MITDAMLRAAAAELDEAMLVQLVDDDECDHVFSKRFCRKMDKVIYRANHPFLTVARRVAAAILLLLFIGGSVLMFSPNAKAAFVNWIRKVHSTSNDYYPPEGVTPAESQYTYEPGWIPEDYTLWIYDELENATSWIYSDNEKLLTISIYRKTTVGAGKVAVITGEHTYQQVTVTGLPADLYISNIPGESSSLVWTNEESVLFVVKAHLEPEIMIKIGESLIVKKK